MVLKTHCGVIHLTPGWVAVPEDKESIRISCPGGTSLLVTGLENIDGFLDQVVLAFTKKQDFLVLGLRTSYDGDALTLVPPQHPRIFLTQPLEGGGVRLFRNAQDLARCIACISDDELNGVLSSPEVGQPTDLVNIYTNRAKEAGNFINIILNGHKGFSEVVKFLICAAIKKRCQDILDPVASSEVVKHAVTIFDEWTEFHHHRRRREGRERF